MAQIKYRLQLPIEARTDGSGCLNHDITTIYSEDEGLTWHVHPAPGSHRTVVVPREDIDAALVGTNAQKVAAYKAALYDNRNTIALPTEMPTLTANDLAGLNAYLVEYADYVSAKTVEDVGVASAANDANDFVEQFANEAGQVEFSL